MSHIVQRQDRFYVVAYDGLDPLTGRERRRWHPAEERPSTSPPGSTSNAMQYPCCGLGRSRSASSSPTPGSRTSAASQLRATTAYRYAWFVERYIQPMLGEVPLRRLHADHLDHLYDDLGSAGGGRDYRILSSDCEYPEVGTWDRLGLVSVTTA